MADLEPGVVVNKRDVEEGLLAASGRPLTYGQEDEDDVSIKKATCMKKLFPQKSRREMAVGIGGGIVVVALLIAVVIAISTTRAARPTVVILVSIDGFMYDYMYNPKFNHPNLNQMAARGVLAELIPQFPTLTFPNHWAIITGLYPESNGIVGNRFLDPATGEEFVYSDPTVALNPKWWKGLPFWSVARQAGIKTASYFWPGSEVAINGSAELMPNYVISPYSDSVPGETRVNQVLSWLDLDWEDRPSFITLYFSEVDSAAHNFGPDSQQVADAISRIDTLIGSLLQGIDNPGRQSKMLVNLVVVSDHGMTSISSNKTILLDEIIDMNTVTIPDINGAVVNIWPNNPNDSAAVDYLVGRLRSGLHPYAVYRKDQLPYDFHLAKSPNVAPIIVVADEGWSITTRANFQQHPTWFDGGAHGYDPRERNMHGIFLAHGPSVRERTTPFGTMHNTEVFNLLGCALGIESGPSNGTWPCIEGVLTDRVMRTARSRPYPGAL